MVGIRRKKLIIWLDAYLVFITVTGNIEPSVSIDSKTKCTTDWVLGQVKNYLESGDFGIIVSTGDLARIINPQAIWDNLQGIKNICESEEAQWLRVFCGNRDAMLVEIVGLWLNNDTNEENLVKTFAKTIHLQTWTYVMDAAVHMGKGGRRLEHYCDRVQGIDVAGHTLNYGEVDRRLKKLGEFSLATFNPVHGTTLNLKVTKHTHDVLKSIEKSEPYSLMKIARFFTDSQSYCLVVGKV